MKIVGNKLYDVCRDCGQIVCMNKKLLGSYHICVGEEEKAHANYQAWLNQEYNSNKKALEGAK